jgi:uncharacterized hydrophobic protein (TIGR00271 family)
MLIAPLMTPILGIASSLVMGRTRRVFYLLIAVAIASTGNVGLAYLMMLVADVPLGMSIPAEVMARTDPGIEELMVALAAGIAGAYVHKHREEISLLPGVAIGVSLVPPLSAAGMLLYFGEPQHAWEATLLYLTNLSAIVLSACVVFLVLGMRPPMRETGLITKVSLGTTFTFAMVALITLHLGSVTLERFREVRDEENVAAVVSAWAGDNPVEILRVDVLERSNPRIVEIWLLLDIPLYLAREVVPPWEQYTSKLTGRDLYAALRRVLGPDTHIVLRGQPRHSATIDLKTGDYLGLHTPSEESD